MTGIITCLEDKMSPILIAVLLVQVILAKNLPDILVKKHFHQCNVTCYQSHQSSSEEQIRRELDLFKKSQVLSNESESTGHQQTTITVSRPKSEENDSLEQLTVARRPLSEHSEILILLTEFANLIYLLLLTNPESHQQHPDVWQNDLLVSVQPRDNFTTIFHKLEDYNRAQQTENLILENQGHYIWVPYGLLKAIHKAITVEQQMARERAKVKATRFELINTGVPIVAKTRKRINCEKYAKAYQKLKKAEEEFLKYAGDLAQVSSEERNYHRSKALRTKMGCQCRKGVTVVASKLS